MKHILKKSARGFTLIELLVVIAIIAILSTIVLASLNGARQKAKNARIRSEISNMRAQAELFYSFGDKFSYDGVCGTAGAGGAGTTGSEYTLASLLTSVENNAAGNIVFCSEGDDGWSVSAELVGDDAGQFFCADSTGYSGLAAATTDGAFNACNPV